MKEKQRNFQFYLLLGIVYAFCFGLIKVVFYLIFQEEISFLNILIECIFFGFFMSLFELWLHKKRK